MRLYKPEVFQGSLRRKNYFEGWYSFVPFMECNHGVVSVNHDLTGRISLNDNVIEFDGGKGYIEKDWGVSFPEAWIWVQSNNFSRNDASFMLSIAKIPWIGRYFIGFLSYLYLDKQFYLFNTYNKSTFTDIQNKEEALHITLKSKTYNLRLRIIKNSFCDLQAPVSGEMSRRIKESIDSEIELQLLDLKGNTVFQDTGKKVGLEIITEIFNYL
ncbi:MAG TPA: tocopherol cyclase family protein [Bacteroidales bacterium]|nr:tocopherol cyclase family protein [Bacteroidales bacterium]HPJ58770.1 tocopherol cyclase family protein [Bacteroidales bacterium]HPR11920.1 tocopherol cyclase family protein [Bacteroidales bacterium]